MIALDDKYRLLEGRALMSGRQALVRLPVLQRQADRRHGLRTAGYISGYRGSPLGGYDLELWKAAEILAANDIVFSPGVNEDLALAAVAGTQQLEFVPGRKVDGVFGFWYGKGPGVDRSGDAIKHANLAGVSAAGGVVLLFGDDHAGKSSTTAHQSDLTLASWGVPVLYPGSVAEIIELGLAAVAMSRFSGLLVGLKLVNETADGSAVVDLAAPPEFVAPHLPEPAGGVHIRQEMVAVQQQDARLVRKLPRAAAFARANNLDRIVFGAAAPRFVIATAGKALGDVLAALEALGIDEESAQRVGIGVYRIALIFPLDASGLQDAARAAEEILFVEEKRPQAELQAKALLFNSAIRPRISGKTAPDGTALLPADAPLTGHVVAVALAHRLRATLPQVDRLLPGLGPAAERISERLATVAAPPGTARRPAFCPGCPHNLSTKVPEGAIGATGIGCHGMAVFHPDRNPIPMMQMGGEGANWIGLSRFVATRHIFQNLGDGTYNHSGSLAVRAAVQAGTNITFKILFNDAVAMTGGQPVEGRLTVARVAQQVIAEGVRRVVVVAEEPRRFKRETLPAGTELRHRDELMAVQESLCGEGGVSVLIYDQVCAAEKRRRRKAGAFPDPDRRIFINALVCEGCGDCSAESNCLAIQPLESELGTKRKIDQSACNKDVSCVKGFCPSFVTVEGARLRGAVRAAEPADDSLQAPVLPVVTDRFDLLITGIGGSGVVTVSAILGMAARIDGLGASLYDMTGLSQKGGAVFSHVRLHRLPGIVPAARVGPGQATVVIACDLVAGVHPECLGTISDRSRIFANANLTETADFQVRGHTTIEPGALLAKLAGASREELRALAATRLAEKLFGDSVGANMLMLGYAWQLGGIPLTLAAIESAIRLNGRSVEMNLAAFSAGRRAAVSGRPTPVLQTSLQEFVAGRAADLARYWNSRYAERYSALVGQAQKAAAALDRGDDLVWSIARSAYKLMAYKDEYEVARLYSDGRFRAALSQEFASMRTIKVHLAPPLLCATDPRTGRPRKMTFGAWIMPLFALLARLRRLRESPFDPFARLPERRLERALRDTYLRVVGQLTATVSDRNVGECIEIARAPLDVRGYGPVKARAAQALLDRLLRLDSTTPPRSSI